MKLQYLGTAASEGVPALFCNCENCKRSRNIGGKNIRTRSQAIVDDKLLIDFPADTYMHFLTHVVKSYNIKTCIITHSHSDHLYSDDAFCRLPPYAHVNSSEPLTFYSAKSGYKMLKNTFGKYSETEHVHLREVTPFVPFIAEGYGILPLEATHDKKSTPVLYVIEKDGKRLFYSHDSDLYSEKTWTALKEIGKPMNLVSLDCTDGCITPRTYVGHMSLYTATEAREKMLKSGIADGNTVFVLNHFSHNAVNVVYDDFVKIAEKENFLVSYDGMTVEF